MTNSSKYVAIAALVALLIALCGCRWFDFYPSDSQMEATLKRQEADFARLIQMLNEDSPADWVYPEKVLGPAPDKVPNRVEMAIPKERQDEYRRLLAAVGASYMSRHRDGSITFEAWTYSSLVTRETKSFVYSEKPPSPLVPALERAEGGSTELMEKYKHIGGNWYIQYTHEVEEIG